MILALLVLCRIVSNPFSNVFQKMLTHRGAHPVVVILATHALLSLVCLPLIFVFPVHGSREFWLDMVGVSLLTVSGNAVLVQAMKLSDLSVLGPVNAYKSIISLLPGMIFLREFPGMMGIAGMGLIVAGSYFLVDKAVTQPQQNLFVRFFTERGVQLRFAAMTLAAVEAVFLKKALLLSGAWATFSMWALTGFITALLYVLLVLRRALYTERPRLGTNAPLYAALATTTGLMQWCTIVVLGGFKVGYALALFQTSTLISVLLGYKLFKEQNILERLIGSIIMVAGAMLIVVGR